MKRPIFLLLFMLLPMAFYAQKAKEDFKRDRTLSGSNYVAYPGPHKAMLTKAPAGYQPFYLSHYGRHGSRYLIGTADYDKPYFELLKADSLGKLTAKGKEVLRKVRMIREEALSRDGELTLRGAQQHQEIARRMFKRFPQIFQGNVHVDAKSTIVIRCILSMENALQELSRLNPHLRISHDASMHDMYYMNFNDTLLFKQRMPEKARKAFDTFYDRHDKHERVMREIFNDDTYWAKKGYGRYMNYALFKMASNVQSTELRHQLSLYDLFTDEEIYENWLPRNAWWYINYGASPLNGAKQPYSQRRLLRRIIHEADSCMALEHPGATLRYGHDTMVMPLTCLLDLNGFGQQIEDLEQLDKSGWRNYEIFPMACNIQFVFYRRSLADKDVIFKVLLNEDEASLPLKTDIAPYYHWKDFKDFFLKKLNDYEPLSPIVH